MCVSPFDAMAGLDEIMMKMIMMMTRGASP